MRRSVLATGIGVVAAVLVTVGLATAGANDDPGGPIGDRVPPPPDAAQAQRTTEGLAAPGAVVATGDGVSVEAVEAPAPSEGASTAPLRLTLHGGPFAVRAMPIVVRVDGRVIGRARPSPDLSAASTVSFDRSWLRVGAQVTWSYGENGPQSGARTIAVVVG